MPIVQCLVIVLFVHQTIGNIDNMSVRKPCKQPLLVAAEQIPDTSFRSSSYWSDMIASEARWDPRDELVMKAWCPKVSVNPRKYTEWIEVDLGELHIITMIQTMGRKAQAQGREYTPEYQLNYKREVSEPHFRVYKTKTDDNLLKGNDDAGNPSINPLEHPIVARIVRIYPTDRVNTRHVCLKLELIGCPFEDGLLEYQIPQGDPSSGGLDGHFLDETYDGKIMPEHSGNQMYLESGMGKLADNRVEYLGPSDDSQNVQYVGWQRRADREEIVMNFRFDGLRNFTSMRLHAANAFRMLVRLPKLVVIRFSVDGRNYNLNNQIRHVIEPDSHLSTPRWLTIFLGYQVARVLRVQLYFDDRGLQASGGEVYPGKWILLSEVKFDSTVVSLLPSSVIPGPRDIRESVAVTKPPIPIRIIEPDSVHSVEISRPNPSQMTVQNNSKAFNESESYYVVIIVACLVGAFLLLLLVAIVWARRRRCSKKNKHNNHIINMTTLKEPGGHMHLDFQDGRSNMMVNGKSVMSGGIYTSLPNNEDDERQKNDLTFPIRGQMNTFNGMGTVAGQVREYASTTLLSKPLVNSPPPPYPTNHTMIGMPFGFSMMPSCNSTSDTTLDSQGGYAKPQIFSNSIIDLMEVVSPYGTTPVSKNAASISGSTKNQPQMYITQPPLPPLNMRFPSDLSIQGVSGTTVYSVPGDATDSANGTLTTSVGLADVDLLEVARSRLELREKLGEGQFGEVCLAFLRSDSPSSTNLDGSFDSRTDSVPGIQVAVKMLRADVSEQAKKDFYHEMRMLSRLDNPHIVRVLGVVTATEPMCVLVEYMKYGDLHQFLQNKFPPADICNNFAMMGTMTTTLPAGRVQAGLSYGCLLYMAGQIASGMKYMESLNMVHRDLAARNCLVGAGYQIKISDFGMSRSLYSSDYYRIQGRAILPIRWMAWESVLLGKFTPKSDVWAFGVTLWEILNYCHAQPFAHLRDEDVIRNCGHVYASDGYQEYLPCPPGPCPREIYDLMRECWNRDESMRPTFHEIHMFLHRKTMGYNSSDDYRLPFLMDNSSFMPPAELALENATNPSAPYAQNATIQMSSSSA